MHASHPRLPRTSLTRGRLRLQNLSEASTRQMTPRCVGIANACVLVWSGGSWRGVTDDSVDWACSLWSLMWCTRDYVTIIHLRAVCMQINFESPVTSTKKAPPPPLPDRKTLPRPPAKDRRSAPPVPGRKDKKPLPLAVTNVKDGKISRMQSSSMPNLSIDIPATSPSAEAHKKTGGGTPPLVKCHSAISIRGNTKLNRFTVKNGKRVRKAKSSATPTAADAGTMACASADKVAFVIITYRNYSNTTLFDCRYRAAKTAFSQIQTVAQATKQQAAHRVGASKLFENCLKCVVNICLASNNTCICRIIGFE